MDDPLTKREALLKSTRDFLLDKPDYTKIEQVMNDYENEYLTTLSNIEWVMYPFIKTFKTVTSKLRCCKRREQKENNKSKRN